MRNSLARSPVIRIVLAAVCFVVVFASMAALAFAGTPGPPGGCTPPGHQYGPGASQYGPSGDQYGPPGLDGGCPPGVGR
jgi:hypothetical protein